MRFQLYDYHEHNSKSHIELHYKMLTDCSLSVSSRRRLRHLAAASLFLSLLTRLFSSSSGVSWKKRWKHFQHLHLCMHSMLFCKKPYTHSQENEINFQSSWVQTIHFNMSLTYRFVTCAPAASWLAQGTWGVRAGRGKARARGEAWPWHVIWVQGHRLGHGGRTCTTLPWCHRGNEGWLHHPLQVLTCGDGSHCRNEGARHVHPWSTDSCTTTHPYTSSGRYTLLWSINTHRM